MGLAERFKDKLNNKDIFEKTEKSLNDGNIQYISKPLTENIYVHPKDIHTSGNIDNIEKIMELGSKYNANSTSQLEDLETEIIRSEEHTSELQSPDHLVCRLLLE